MLFLLLFFWAYCTAISWADPVSLLDPKEEVPLPSIAPAEAENSGDGFEQMKDFIRQENERLQNIKLLSLDLQRADLELKKRQIEVKLAELSKKVPMPIELSKIGGPDIKLAGIFVHAQIRQALMEVHGVYVHADEGKTFGDGSMVKQVLDDGVVIQRADGREETLPLGA